MDLRLTAWLDLKTDNPLNSLIDQCKNEDDVIRAFKIPENLTKFFTFFNLDDVYQNCKGKYLSLIKRICLLSEGSRSEIKNISSIIRLCHAHLIDSQDYTIFCGGESIKTDLFLLRAEIPYFTHLLASGLKEAKTNELTLPEFNPKTVRLVLEYAKKDDLERIHFLDQFEGTNDIKFVYDLLILANFWGMEDLVTLCEEWFFDNVEFSVLDLKQWGDNFSQIKVPKLNEFINFILKTAKERGWNTDDENFDYSCMKAYIDDLLLGSFVNYQFRVTLNQEVLMHPAWQPDKESCFHALRDKPPGSYTLYTMTKYGHVILLVTDEKSIDSIPIFTRKNKWMEETLSNLAKALYEYSSLDELIQERQFLKFPIPCEEVKRNAALLTVTSQKKDLLQYSFSAYIKAMSTNQVFHPRAIPVKKLNKFFNNKLPTYLNVNIDKKSKFFNLFAEIKFKLAESLFHKRLELIYKNNIPIGSSLYEFTVHDIKKKDPNSIALLRHSGYSVTEFSAINEDSNIKEERMIISKITDYPIPKLSEQNPLCIHPLSKNPMEVLKDKPAGSYMLQFDVDYENLSAIKYRVYFVDDKQTLFFTVIELIEKGWIGTWNMIPMPLTPFLENFLTRNGGKLKASVNREY